jgi:hypothetical protein
METLNSGDYVVFDKDAPSYVIYKVAYIDDDGYVHVEGNSKLIVDVLRCKKVIMSEGFAPSSFKKVDYYDSTAPTKFKIGDVVILDKIPSMTFTVTRVEALNDNDLLYLDTGLIAIAQNCTLVSRDSMRSFNHTSVVSALGNVRKALYNDPTGHLNYQFHRTEYPQKENVQDIANDIRRATGIDCSQLFATASEDDIEFLRSLAKGVTQKKLEKNNMNYFEALNYAKRSGRSIIPTYYKATEFQFYFDENGIFVCQPFEKEPRKANLEYLPYINGTWRVYNAPYKRYNELIAKDKKRLLELWKKWGHMIKDIEEWKALRKKYPEIKMEGL